MTSINTATCGMAMWIVSADGWNRKNKKKRKEKEKMKEKIKQTASIYWIYISIYVFFKESTATFSNTIPLLDTVILASTTTPNGAVVNTIQTWTIPLNNFPNLQTTILSLVMNADVLGGITTYTLQDTKMIISYAPVPTPAPPTPVPTPTQPVQTQNIVSSEGDDINIGIIIGGM